MRATKIALTLLLAASSGLSAGCNPVPYVMGMFLSPVPVHLLSISSGTIIWRYSYRDANGDLKKTGAIADAEFPLVNVNGKYFNPKLQLLIDPHAPGFIINKATVTPNFKDPLQDDEFKTSFEVKIGQYIPANADQADQTTVVRAVPITKEVNLGGVYTSDLLSYSWNSLFNQDSYKNVGPWVGTLDFRFSCTDDNGSTFFLPPGANDTYRITVGVSYVTEDDDKSGKVE